jgi:sensor histidine kinase YesM
MSSNFKRQYFTIAILLSLAIGITIHFPAIMSYIFDGNEGRRGGRDNMTLSHLSTELAITILVAFLMFTLNYFIFRPVDKRGKLGIWSLMLGILLTVVSVFILNIFLFSQFSHVKILSHGRGFREEFIYENFFVAGLVIGCILVIRLIYQKQMVQLENESLRREALQSQFESLKNQLSPHFLFNSLTALKTLIYEAPATAQDYVNNLSKALRYTLQSNEKQLVTLKEEMSFMESYLFLIKLRFDTNLTITSSIIEEYYSYRLPPLTIQTLVENAVKHNEISRRRPLTIMIQTTENESLIVWNEIQEKITSERGTGIGLANLSKQYQLLLDKNITISIENKQFRVEFPLIKPGEK